MNMKDERQFVGYSKYRSRLVDGHVHTELCPHGSGDRTALMIEKAIVHRNGEVTFAFANGTEIKVGA